MKKLIISILVLLIAVWLGLQFGHDPGRVMIAMHGKIYSMTVMTAIILLIIVLFIIYVVYKLLHGSNLVSYKFQRWMNNRKKRKTRRNINRGLIELTEGNWKNAEHCLINSAKASDTPVINYLAAARAAHEQGAYQRRDDYLRQAHLVANNAEVAVSLTQAELQMSHQQFEQALATLSHLHEIVPQHTYVLKLLKKIYIELNEWQGLLDILPELRKNKVGKVLELDQLESQAYQILLTEAKKESTQVRVQTLWQQLPKRLHNDPDLVTHYVDCLLSFHQDQVAETLLQTTLKKIWDDRLVRLYGLINSDAPDRQLALAENWLKQQQHDAELLLCLGRIAKRCQLWGKARSYFEDSVRYQPRAIAYRELADLLDQLNEKTLAYNNYRLGLQLIEG